MKQTLTTPDGAPLSSLCFGTMQFGESRRLLGMEQVDLLYLHQWNDDTLEET